MIPPEYSIPDIYESSSLGRQKDRYSALADRLYALTQRDDAPLFVSAPGRTELGGNHTDHNRGLVLCAAVEQDLVGVVLPRDDHLIRLEAEGFEETYELDLHQLEPMSREEGNSRALIRGVAAHLKAKGHDIGGFDAVVSSDVPVGSGLSSSASFEVLVGGIFNSLYNHGAISPETLARVGQRAENEYFGKPCGLMDQLACAVGGLLSIDFGDDTHLKLRRFETDLSDTDYRLSVVDTGGSHADLTDAYASIPREMKAAARVFGAEVLREVSHEDLTEVLARIRRERGDRTALRALHYFTENERVRAMCDALSSGDVSRYLDLVASSGRSSLGVLQNIIPPDSDGQEQPVALALGFSNAFFEERGRGVCRIQGGGFAGTIQAYVHRDDYDDYVRRMERLLGPGCVQNLRIRSIGVTRVSALDLQEQ